MTDESLSAARRGAANLVKMLTGHGATVVVGVLSGVFVPRTLGVESYGQYVALMAVITILQTVSSGGLQQVEVRYLAPLWHSQRLSDAVILGSSIWTVRLVLSVMAGVAAVCWFSLSPQLEQGEGMVIVLGAVCLLQAAQDATRSQFLSIGHVGKLMGFEFLRVSLTLALVMSLFPWFNLPGVFVALLVLDAILLGANGIVLLRLLPLRPRLFRWSSLRPYIGYSWSTFIRLVAMVVQRHFAIYAVAAWATRNEAAFLALAVQAYSLTRGLFLSGRRSLMPILAELEEQGRIDRLAYWGGLMMRYGAAGICMGAVSWALIGEYAVAWLLTDAFAPVYSCITVILLSVMFSCCGASCMGLLLTRGLAGIAAANAVLFAVVTSVGLLVVLHAESSGSAYAICWVYVLAAVLFWAGTYIALGVYGGIWLPVRRTLLLLLPAGLVWPATVWDGGFLPRLVVLAIFLVLHSGLAIWLGLLPADEIRKVLATLQQSKRKITTQPERGVWEGG